MLARQMYNKTLYCVIVQMYRQTIQKSIFATIETFRVSISGRERGSVK